MFSRKKRTAAAPPAIQTTPAPPPPPPPPPAAAPPSAALALQQAAAHGRHISAASTITASSGTVRDTPRVSPLQMTFDFEVPQRSPFSRSSNPSLDSLRPRTSDGLGAHNRKSHIGLAPPRLPPIPRVASRHGKASSNVSYESGGSDSEAASQTRRPRDEGDNVSVSSKKSAKSTASRKSFKIFEMTMDELNRAPAIPSRPASSASNVRPGTSSGLPKMEGTLFPKVDAPVLPPLRTEPAAGGAMMDRSFIDSRDRVFQPAPAKLPGTHLLSSSSTPDLSSTLRGPPPPRPALQKSPLSPPTPAADLPAATTRPRTGSSTSSRSVLRKKSSRPDLQAKRTQSSMSGTTAWSKESGKGKDDAGTPTVGTPYAETSPAFPLPQHVATRPRTAGAESKVAGITVPTYHTSSTPSTRPETAKSEKRKTKFLNPMAMFSRRKSAQNEADAQKEIAAQEAALARQRDVAAAGVKKVPNDFDPRIRGRVVHDFSAPNRQSLRSFTFNDAAEGLRGHQTRLHSANSAPVGPELQQDGADVRQSVFSGVSSLSGGTRKSLHAPVFVEHLADTPMGTSRMHADRAESLANRQFLQRTSHVSNVSQESAVLPPFARRSQVMDPLQALHFIDDTNKRSSDPSSTSGRTDQNRDSGVSSLSSVSPITARNSVMPSDPAGQSMSPISPISPSRTGFGAGGRPKSMASSHLRESTVFIHEEKEFPQLRPVLQRNPASDPGMDRIPSPPRVAPPPPPATLLAAGRSLSPPGPISPTTSLSFSRGSTPGEEHIANAVHMSRPPSSPPKVVEKRASAVGHTKRSSSTPKHHVSNASRFSFQLGGSAAEELALEEKARKMRSGVSGFSPAPGGKAGSPSEDEDEYFDEDAMDDMDEMELREEPDERPTIPGVQQSQQSVPPSAILPPQIQVPPRHSAMPPSQPSPNVLSPGIINANDGGLQLMVSESDGETMSGEDEESDLEGGYYDLVDYGSVTHSRPQSVTTDQSHKPSLRGGSLATSPLQQRFSPTRRQFSPTTTNAPPHFQHKRILSDDSALTIDTNVIPSSQSHAAYAQDSFSPRESIPNGVGGARPRSGFYMQPAAAGYSPTATEKSLLGASTDGGDAEKRSTVDAGSFDVVASPLQLFNNKHKSARSNSTMSSTDGNKRPFSDATLGAGSSSRSSGPHTGSTGLGLGGFGDFHFSDTPDQSRPVSKTFQNENRLTGDSETIPAHTGWLAQDRKRRSGPLMPSAGHTSKGSPTKGGEHRYTGSVGRNLQARKSSLAEFLNADAATDGDDEDDMYFDGGGFEGDLQTGKQELGASMNEEVFDDDDRFKRGQPMMNGYPSPLASNNPVHQRATSAISLGSDGPYPSFAMPNPAKARQRDSQMLLEDLVLQNAAPVDPRCIPQRNPSEDAKRLGLSGKVPPLPAQPGNLDAADRVQSNLQAYHAALADAANKAASEGRFLRTPSVNTVATQRSESVYSKAPDADKSAEDLGQYESEALSPDAQPGTTDANGKVHPSAAQQPTSTLTSTLNHSISYSPPKMSFDFGFDTGPLISDSAFDDTADDDDIVSAANADVLASDDAGFYGQEFGFFAKARPNLGDGVQATNGGFFGEDGDDGLARNKSLQEPNLTPITERSEFSTRNSFIGSGGMFGPPSAVSMTMGGSALARLPVSPLVEEEGDVVSLEQLKRLRLSAFGGSNGSLGSASGASSHRGVGPGQQQGYFGAGGVSPMLHAYSPASGSEGSANSAPGSAHPGSGMGSSRLSNGGLHESPASAGPGPGPAAFTSPLTEERTPRKPASAERPESPATARKAPKVSTAVSGQGHGHSRNSSGGADSVTYVRESDPHSPTGQARWVLERRRTSEQGLSELVGREVVRGGWI